MNMNPKDIIGPTAVLVGVCLVFTAAVVGTNSLTAEKIAVLNQQTADEAKMEVLPEADSFSTETVSISTGDVEYYAAANGAGYVFNTSYKGYGGAVGVMTGISADGEITGVKVVDCNETHGNTFEVTKTGKTAENQIDAISGATITSRAVTNSVNYAIEAYQQITGGAN